MWKFTGLVYDDHGLIFKKKIIQLKEKRKPDYRLYIKTCVDKLI